MERCHVGAEGFSLHTTIYNFSGNGAATRAGSHPSGWRITERTRAFRARVVSYAGDFAILSGGCAAEALEWAHGVTASLGLTLNEAKTSLRDARKER